MTRNARQLMPKPAAAAPRAARSSESPAADRWRASAVRQAHWLELPAAPRATAIPTVAAGGPALDWDPAASAGAGLAELLECSSASRAFQGVCTLVDNRRTRALVPISFRRAVAGLQGDSPTTRDRLSSHRNFARRERFTSALFDFDIRSGARHVRPQVSFRRRPARDGP